METDKTKKRLKSMLGEVEIALEHNNMDRMVFEAENLKERQTLQLMRKMIKNNIMFHEQELKEEQIEREKMDE